MRDLLRPPPASVLERAAETGGGRRWPAVVRRHRVLSALVAVVVLLTPVWWSLGRALTNPALGQTLGARAAEWARDHGGGGLVVWAENTWYSRRPPPVGGQPAADTIPTPAAPPTTSGPLTAAPAVPPHLTAPAALPPFVPNPVPGEGDWRPTGRRVNGLPGVYTTFLRPDSVHTSLVAGVAWMDTRLLRAQLYSGSYVPGGGPWKYTAPVAPQAARSLVAAFNGGFRLKDAEGGYYSEGRTVAPLRAGSASLVITKDGTITVGEWGRDVSMSPDVVAVRQNLHLLVDQGRPVSGLDSNDTTAWGATLGNQVYVWRSGVGVTKDGALVYVGGPGLSITSLAGLLAHAGAVRAMELDINTDWVNLSVWTPSGPTDPATPANGESLLPAMVGKPGRYFTGSWARDFVTLSAR